MHDLITNPHSVETCSLDVQRMTILSNVCHIPDGALVPVAPTIPRIAICASLILQTILQLVKLFRAEYLSLIHI